MKKTNQANALKRTARIYECCLWMITVLAFIAAAVIAVPKIAGIHPYIILSSSMEPTIPTGSLVFVNTRNRQAAENDIVTFTMSNGKDDVTVTHRIVEVTKDGFVTKGDNNEVEDLNLLTMDKIIGTYAASIPYAGYVISKLSRKAMLVAAVWLFGLHAFCFVLNAVVDDNCDPHQSARDPTWIQNKLRNSLKKRKGETDKTFGI
ncbi:MAG: signal peptidase I [Lachnospiraceae bacterium]|nr:signal peptidase I [Lachnospiraceae bacterium]